MDTFHTFPPHIKIPLIAMTAIFVVFMGLVFAHHIRSVEPISRQAPEGHVLCALPTDAPRLLERASKDYFQCASDHIDPWFRAYPDEVEELEKIYEALQNSRSHDLRGSAAAARFLEHNPVRFQTQTLTLTEEEVASNRPTLEGSPAEVAGEFQRFFVDRNQERLFLTSQTEGLVSLSIAERYQFKFEGAMNRESGREFFIYNDQFAFVEEHSDRRTGRDLVVLDISNHEEPKEAYRLPSLLVQAPLEQDYFPELTSMPSYPPSFEHYLQVKEGRAVIPACGAPPQLASDPNIRCRPDGSCYRWEPRQEPGDFACVAELPQQGDRSLIAPLSYKVTGKAASIWAGLPILEVLGILIATILFLLFGFASLLLLLSPFLVLKSKTKDVATLEEEYRISSRHRWKGIQIPLFLFYITGCAILLGLMYEEFYYSWSPNHVEVWTYFLLLAVFPAFVAAIVLVLASPLFMIFPGLRPFLPSAIRSAPGRWSALFAGLLLTGFTLITALFGNSIAGDGYYWAEATEEVASISISSGSVGSSGSMGSSPQRSANLIRPGQQEAPPAPSPSVNRQASSDRAPLPQGGQGGAGSLSQMMVAGETLYILSARQGQSRGYLSTFDISRPERPTLQNVLSLNNGPEALQVHDSLLLIAGRDALITASIAYPQAPRFLGQHQQRCPVNFDPVVVHGSFAYRTIIVDPNNRARCQHSQLETIDLSQPHQPRLINTHRLEGPRGLAILHGYLFVADENIGIRLFSLANLRQPRLLATFELPRVKDLVISDFDLYALTPNEIQTFYIAPLYEENTTAAEVAPYLPAATTVRQAR